MTTLKAQVCSLKCFHLWGCVQAFHNQTLCAHTKQRYTSACCNSPTMTTSLELSIFNCQHTLDLLIVLKLGMKLILSFRSFPRLDCAHMYCMQNDLCQAFIHLSVHRPSIHPCIRPCIHAFKLAGDSHFGPLQNTID